MERKPHECLREEDFLEWRQTLELMGDFQTTDCQEGQHLDPSDPHGSAYELRWQQDIHSRRNCTSVDQEHDDPIEHDVRPVRHHGQIN